jgi:hypothetical protein
VLRTSRDENRRMCAFGAQGHGWEAKVSASAVVDEQRG